jgi:AcrR family transcriptional regulator
MGVRERRDRERKELKRAILEAAREIAATEGWQAVTIRKVAEKIEYSPPTIYEYFASKEAILGEEIRDGFRLLLADLQAARDQHAEPSERLPAMGRAYWDFVWRHPEMYQVMSGLGGVGFCGEDEPAELNHKAEGEQVMMLFREVLRALLPAVSADELTSKCIVLWSLFHGFIALIMSGRLHELDSAGALGLALRAVEDLLTVWRGAQAPSSV